MTKTTVRPMAPRDIPAVVGMIKKLSAFHDDTAAVTAQTLARDTDPRHPWFYVFVADTGTTLVGYMILIRLAKVADGLRGFDINHMFVAADVRGTGIGRQMIDKAKAHALSLGCSYMFISTAPQNQAAQASYVACGFDPFPDTGGPRFRMQLDGDL